MLRPRLHKVPPAKGSLHRSRRRCAQAKGGKEELRGWGVPELCHEQGPVLPAVSSGIGTTILFIVWCLISIPFRSPSSCFCALRRLGSGARRSTCSVQGCAKFPQRRGVCVEHGAVVPRPKKRVAKICTVGGCSSLAQNCSDLCYRQ